MTTASNEPPGTTIELKSVDLVSVTSSEFIEDDNISFDEGRLQQWNLDEFWAQFKSASAAIVLVVACCIQSTWSINEYLKLLWDKGNETAWWNDTESASGYDFVDQLFSSESVIVTGVIVSWNVGAIFGGVLGAFIAPVLTNKVIYVCHTMYVFSGLFPPLQLSLNGFLLFPGSGNIVSVIQRYLTISERQRLSIHQGQILSRAHVWAGAVDRDCASSRIVNEKSSSSHVDIHRVHVHIVVAPIDDSRMETGQVRSHFVPGEERRDNHNFICALWCMCNCIITEFRFHAGHNCISAESGR